MKKILLSFAMTAALCGTALADDYVPIAAEPKPMGYTLTNNNSKSNVFTRTTDQMTRCWDDSAPYKNFFSLRAGVNFANLHNDYAATKAQTGFNAAGLYNISLMKTMPLFLQTGLAFEMKGARDSGILTSATTHFKSYNIEIPVVLTFDVPINSKMAIVPELGVYYSIAVAGSMTTDNGDTFYRPFKKESTTLADGTSITNSRLMSRNDFGIRAGASFRYCRYLIGFAYDAGVINNFAKNLRDLDYKGKTGTWSVNLGYRFNP